MTLTCESFTVIALIFSLHAQALSTRTAMGEVSGVPIVQVSVNGTGPYPFVLDTGANVTVMTQVLFRNLHILTESPVTMATALGDTDQERGEAATLELGGLIVEHVEVNTVADNQLGSLRGKVLGVLGENFLRHFDLLIDNDHHQLTLDGTSWLSNSIAGEHVPFARQGMYQSVDTVDRVVLPLRLTFPMRTLFFVVDSGTNTPVLFPEEQETTGLERASGHGNISSFSRTQSCHVKRTTLAIASQSFANTTLVTCDGRTRSKSDSDGLLPTGMFHQLFISHQKGFVIANPSRRKVAGTP